MSAIFFLSPQNVLLHSGRQTIHGPAILSGVGTSTSSVFVGLGLTSVTVTMNVTGAVTGTSPNLVLTLEELDPGDLTTILQTVSASAMTATLQNRTLRMNLKHGDAVRVKWALTGTSPVFNGVYTTLTVGEARLPYLGAQATADSLAVNIASDQVVPVKSEVQIDYHTGGTTQNLSVTGIALPSASGAVAGGTSTNPIRTDPTGTTAQPVSGTVAVSSLPAITGTVAVSSMPAITGTVAISGTVPISAASLPLPASAAQDRTTAAAPFAVRVSNGTAFLIGQTNKAGSLPVTVANDQETCASPAVTSVTASASVVTLLAANANRNTFSVFNESTSAILYVKCGSGASASSYSARLQPGGYYEPPANVKVTSIVTGIWSAASGAARITEFAA